MLKLYMNEPFATKHELAQARRVVEVLSRKHGDGATARLCFNFSLGGKSLDAAYITTDRFVIIEFKAVGGDVNCGSNIENDKWMWSDAESMESHVISTAPYANPFSQAKNYRIAVIGELEQRQRGFLKNSTLRTSDINFAHWVKSCVLLSRRNADDIRVSIKGISANARNWFCYGSLGDADHLIDNLNHSVSIMPKEIDKLITKEIGLRCVDHVLEHAEDVAEPETQEKLQVPLRPSTSSYAVEAFRKRYGDKTFVPPPKLADSTERKHKTETPRVVNDFADIDSLLKTVERQDDKHAMPSSQAGLVVASGKPISCGFLKEKLKGEMDLHASGYGTIAELDGADAVAIVEEACPDIGRFEVSKVLRFGDRIPADEYDTLLAYFGRKYAPSPWRRIACSGGWINFVFGRELSMEPTCGNERKAVRAARAIVTDFLMPRWLREQIDKAAEGLPSLSATEVQLTSQLSSDDVRRYAQTYLPRSCAEAFVTLDWVLGEELVDTEMSVLDLGCGSGGASLGCLLAIHKHETGKCSVQIDGVDANIHSLAFAEDLIEKSKKVFLDDKVRFNPLEADFSNGIGTDRKYDIVIASKSIGELALRNGENAYAETVRLCAEKLAEDGFLLVVEIPKHEASLREALNSLKGAGIDGWCQCMHITVDGGKENEDFVCACATRKANAKAKEK